MAQEKLQPTLQYKEDTSIEKRAQGRVFGALGIGSLVMFHTMSHLNLMNHGLSDHLSFDAYAGFFLGWSALSFRQARRLARQESTATQPVNETMTYDTLVAPEAMHIQTEEPARLAVDAPEATYPPLHLVADGQVEKPAA